MALLDKFRDRDFRLWVTQRAEVLAQGPWCVPALLVALDELDWELRAFAASCLARLKDPSTAEALQKAYQPEKYLEAQRQILMALIAIGAPSSADVFEAAASSPDPGLRLAGVRGLAVLQDPKFAVRLRSFAQDDDLDVRYEARGGLAALGDAETITGLMNEARARVVDRDRAREVSGEERDNGDRYSQYLMGIALSRAKDESARRLLLDILTAEKPWEKKSFMRMGAAEGFGRRAATGDALPVRVIAGMFQDIPEVRIACTYAVGWAADPALASKIARALTDSQLDVRVNAVVGLGRIGNDEATKFILRALSDRADEVRLAAVRALGSIRRSAATKGLVDSAHDEKYVIRVRAIHELAWRTTEPGVLEALTSASHDPDFGVREQSLAALAHHPDGAAVVEPMKSALGDADYGVRSNACRALAQVADSAGLSRDDVLAKRIATLLLAAAQQRLELAAEEFMDAVRPPGGVEPLLDALDADTRERRGRAIHCLRKMTEQNIPFDPAAEKEARAPDISKWREWWESSGGRLGHRPPRAHLVLTGGEAEELIAAKDYKWKGLDIALLLDSTGSMAGLIRAAKESIDEIVDELGTLLPSLRVSVYTYRDFGSDYLYYGTPLTFDTANLGGFLQNAVHGQGGDIPEAVYEVVTNAMNKLTWRKGAHKVIIFAGDAPWHPESQTDFLRAIRMFCTPENQAELHAVFTDTNRRSLDIRARRERDDPSRIHMPFFDLYKLAARTGRGRAILMDDESTLIRELLVLAFGNTWRADIENVLEFER